MKSDDVVRAIEALSHPSFWDYFVGASTAAAAIGSVVVAVVATKIARDAERGRKDAEQELRRERAENDLREAIRDLIVALSEQVSKLSTWASLPPRIIPRVSETNEQLEELALRHGASLESEAAARATADPRPSFEILRGALDATLLTATPASRDDLEELNRLVLTVVVAPQWHSAAQSLTDIRAALARWGARAEGEARFRADIQEIWALHLAQFQVAESLRETTS